MAKKTEMEGTPLNLACLVWFIYKTVLPKHKIPLHNPRADVYYSSGGVKCCRHMFLLATGGTTTVQVDEKSRGACWPQFFTCNVVCQSAEMALAVFIGLDSCSYLSLFRLKAFLLCTTPAWQCSYVIIDKTTVSGNTCQGLSIVFERNRIPPIMSWKFVLSHWWHGPALRGTTSHKPVDGVRRCFMLTLQYLQFEKPYFSVTQNWEAQADMDRVLYPPGRHTLLLCFWKLWVRLQAHKKT